MFLLRTHICKIAKVDRRVCVKMLGIALAFIMYFEEMARARAGLLQSSAAVDSVVYMYFSIGPGGASLPLPLARDVKGSVNGSAEAGLPYVRARAGPVTGTIAAVGPPVAGGSVGIPFQSAPTSNFFGSARATANALIRGTPAVTAITITSFTPVTALANYPLFAAAGAGASMDPIVLAPLAQDTSALLTVNLLADYPSNPMGTFQLDASSSDNTKMISNASFSETALTNIPGLSTLFSLDISVNSAANSVKVVFNIPEISQPIFASDFTSPESGVYVLNPANASFSVPFTIPAGTLGMDSSGSYGLSLDLVQDTSADVVSLPEPSSMALLCIGLVGFAAIGRKKSCPK